MAYMIVNFSYIKLVTYIFFKSLLTNGMVKEESGISLESQWLEIE